MRVCAVLGDVVGSRARPNRREVHDRLTQELSAVNAIGSPVRPLRVTVGDEFQGSWASLPEALAAVLRLRLSLLPDLDTRYGLGWGEARLLDEERLIEDGPAWWAARRAIVHAKGKAGRKRSASVRVTLAPWDPSESPDSRYEGPDGLDLAEVMNAGFAAVDYLVSTLDAVSLRLLRGALDGRTQAEMAGEARISQSAVSQRFQRDGLWTLFQVHQDLAKATGAARATSATGPA